MLVNKFFVSCFTPSFQNSIKFCSFFLVFNATLNQVSFAQNKIIQFIQQGNYEKASEQIFKKQNRFSSDALLNFSAANFYSYADHPRFNIDSAWFYIMRSDSFLKNEANPKMIKKWKSNGFRPYTLKRLSRNVAQKAFARAEEKNQAETWEYFIANYYQSDWINLAIEKRNALAFKAAQENFTYNSFKEFMEKYPNSSQVHEARQLYDKLLYQTKTQKNTWQAYKKFTEQYPESPYFDEAHLQYQQLIFEEYAESGLLQKFIEFEQNYPDNPNIPAIQDSIYAYSILKGHPKEFLFFSQKFPHNQNAAIARKKYYLLLTADFSIHSIQKFKFEHPDFIKQKLLSEDLKLSQLLLEVFESESGLFGYKNQTDNTIVIPANYFEAADFSGRNAWVSDSSCEAECRYLYINKNGNRITQNYYHEAGDFKLGYALVAKGNCAEGDCLFGLIDQEGNEVVPTIYEELYEPSDNYLLLAKNKDAKYGFISAVGKTIISFQYKDALSFSEGLAPVTTDSLWQYIDENGNAVISSVYYKAGKFSEGLAPAAKFENLWGYIDYTGAWIIPPQYYFAGSFENGIAKVIVKEKNKKGLIINVQKSINKQGKIAPENIK